MPPWESRLVGDSTLAELVGLFGYSTGQLRGDSLWKVRKQLERAGLEISTQTGNWTRDDRFRINLTRDVATEELIEEPEESPAVRRGRPTTSVELPDPFWPTALGLERNREWTSCGPSRRAIPSSACSTCPTRPVPTPRNHAAWEGLIGWAFHAAQRFVRRQRFGDPVAEVRIGPETLLGAYLKPSVLDSGSLRLLDTPHSLNLITIKRASEPPAHLHHLGAVWPGADLRVQARVRQGAAPSADVRSICDCLSLVGGLAPTAIDGATPLGMLNWARVAHRQLTAMPITRFGGVLSNKLIGKFKGSNECAATLALKAHMAHWICAADPDAKLEFEYSDEDDEEDERDPKAGRIGGGSTCPWKAWGSSRSSR